MCLSTWQPLRLDTPAIRAASLADSAAVPEPAGPAPSRSTSDGAAARLAIALPGHLAKPV